MKTTIRKERFLSQSVVVVRRAVGATEAGECARRGVGQDIEGFGATRCAGGRAVPGGQRSLVRTALHETGAPSAPVSLPPTLSQQTISTQLQTVVGGSLRHVLFSASEALWRGIVEFVCLVACLLACLFVVCMSRSENGMNARRSQLGSHTKPRQARRQEDIESKQMPCQQVQRERTAAAENEASNDSDVPSGIAPHKTFSNISTSS